MTRLIIGQGIAGTLLAWELHRRGIPFMVMDEDAPVTSSKIAAGMFTPVSGKRMVKGKDVDEQISMARKTYRELEELLQVKLLHEPAIHHVFGSVKEQNDLSVKSEHGIFFQHVNFHAMPLANLHEPFGAFEVNSSGWVDTALLISGFKEWLITKNAYRKEKFDHSLLSFTDKKINYKDLQADQLIFCEGWKGMYNPLFSAAPFNLCKGELLMIECEGLSEQYIIKKGIYLVPVGNHIYKVGATYSWDDLTELPTEAGYRQLTEKLDELLTVPYKILSHQAGIRPTTETRLPFIIQHVQYPHVFMLNGLGTKGVLTGPWMVNSILRSLEHIGHPL